MIIFKTTENLREYLKDKPASQGVVGFVPTMGALHRGHLSLVNLCRQQNTLTVVSIFVNPLQFNQKSDFDNYPSTIEKDMEMLIGAGVDVLFLPSEKEMYPDENKKVTYDLGNLDQILEGAQRPGHFQGVARVVDLLLQIVQPDNLYLGQKDFQQIKVIQRMIKLKGHHTKVVEAPLVREESGLAMSSRNERLSGTGRKKAAIIYKNLKTIKEEINEFPFSSLRKKAIDDLRKNGFKVDYIELATQKDLKLLNDFDNKIPSRVLVAAWIESVRLIDNIPIP